MAIQQTQADTLERSLRRLGFRLSRTGRTFRIINARGEPAIFRGRDVDGGCRDLDRELHQAIEALKG